MRAVKSVMRRALSAMGIDPRRLRRRPGSNFDEARIIAAWLTRVPPRHEVYVDIAAGDGVTKLSHEIQSSDAATGTLLAWVKMPSLSAATNTSFYLYYGNSDAPNQQDVAGVRTNGFAGVWHLGGSGSGTAGEFKDSTANANYGTGGNGSASATPTQAAGKIGKAQQFDGSNDFVLVPSHSSLQISSALTMSLWVKVNNFNSASQTPLGKASREVRQASLPVSRSNAARKLPFCWSHWTMATFL